MMPTFADYTLEQLRSFTLAQIRTGLKNRIDSLDKAHLIRLVLRLQGVELNDAIPLYRPHLATAYPDGQVKQRVAVREDALGAVTGQDVTDWTYYPSGAVQDIVVSVNDAADKVIHRHRIHHYEDGRQPERREL